MKKTVLLLTGLLSLLSVLFTNCTSKRGNHLYGYKSAIIVYKNYFGNMEAGIDTMMFTDWGNKEVLISPSQHKKQIRIKDTIYVVDYINQTVLFQKIQLVSGQSLNEFLSAEAFLTSDSSVKKIGTDKIAGMKCDIYQTADSSMTVYLAKGKNIIMKTEGKMYGIPVSREVIEIKKNADIPKSVFKYPKNFKFLDLTNTAVLDSLQREYDKAQHMRDSLLMDSLNINIDSTLLDNTTQQ